jgi:hypothetical protein
MIFPVTLARIKYMNELEIVGMLQRNGSSGLIVLDYRNPKTFEIARYTLNPDPAYRTKAGRLQRQLDNVKTINLDAFAVDRGFDPDDVRAAFAKIVESNTRRLETPSETSKVHADGRAKGTTTHEDTGAVYVRGVSVKRKQILTEATNPGKEKNPGEVTRARKALELKALGGSWVQFHIEEIQRLACNGEIWER